ncbi:MAG: leucine-rich repeat protein [Clostridia bacterium]|nr:leucine-rich repeat protein [Clostridia bacterium]
MKTKKLISVLLVAIMVLAHAPMTQFTDIDSWFVTASAAETVQSGTCGDNLTWTLDTETGNLVISGTGNTISSNAFENNEAIKTVTISDNINTIGRKAFSGCENLQKIDFPNNLKTIEGGAFLGCYNLTDVVLPEGLVTIDDNAFTNCASLREIDIPSTVTTIGGYCFFLCSNLESINFNKNSQLSSVNGNYTFGCCYSLKSINLPESLETIGYGIFSSCNSLEHFNIPRNLKSIGAPVASYDLGTSAGSLVSLNNITVNSENSKYFLNENKALCYTTDKGTTYELAVPNSKDLEKLIINEYSNINYYNYITNINMIELSEGVTSFTLDEHGVLFNKNKTVLLKYPAGSPAEEYEIPSSVTSIDYNAFYGASNLKSFSVEEGNTHYSAVDGILYNIDKTELVAFPIGKTTTEFEILPSLKYIEPLSLIEAKNIEKYSVSDENQYFVSDENGVLYKQDSYHKTLFLFPNAKNVTEYTISDDVTIVNSDAFYGSKVEKLNIPSTVLKIERSYYYDSLVKIFQQINYEGVSLYNNVEGSASRLASVAINNSIDFSSNIDDNKLATGKDSATNITYSYEKDCFDYNGDIGFEVIRKTKEEYADAFRGYVDESDDIFFYDIKFYAVGESNNLEIQPKIGKKVKIGFPVPDGYKTANPNLFMVLHKRSDNGKLEFFKPSNNNIEIKDDYIYIWADNFSPFAIVVNYTESNKTVSSIAIAKLPSKTAYTYRNDSLDLSGLALTVTYSDGTTETVTDTSKMKVTGFDNSKTGKQTVTVEYEGLTAEFSVNVKYAWWQWIIRILLLGFLWY